MNEQESNRRADIAKKIALTMGESKREIIESGADWVYERAVDLKGKRPKEETVKLAENFFPALKKFFEFGDRSGMEEFILHLIGYRGRMDFLISTLEIGMLSIFKVLRPILREKYKDPALLLEMDKILDETYEEILFKISDGYQKEIEERLKSKINELKSMEASLENKVKERTAELARANKYLIDSRLALMNILEDIGEARKEAEQEKDKTLSIITNFADGLLVFDEENRLSLANPEAEGLLKIKKDEVVGKSLVELAKFSAFQLFPAGFFGDKIIKIFRKEINLSEEMSLEVTVVPLMRADIKAGFLIILHDVTREKRIEKMKTEFVSLAAHQLRTPLSAIKWTVRMILDGDAGAINDEQKEMLQKSYLSNERMIGLVNDLLNVTRIEEGKYLFKLALSDIAEITRSVADSYSGQALKRNIKLEFSEPAGKIPKLTVDAEKIGLALQNILDNAVKYTPEGGTVFVAVSGDKENIKISVKDTGVGIPANQRERVFSKFFRADNVIRLETEGSGLGLFIAKNIIEAHGGKIWFESKEGEGTTFFFSLPIKTLFKTN